VVGPVTSVALYLLAVREFGRLAAFSSAVLLATDVSFVIAVRDDWGPVAIKDLAQYTAAHPELGLGHPSKEHDRRHRQAPQAAIGPPLTPG
jgi:hypothetical protein